MPWQDKPKSKPISQEKIKQDMTRQAQAQANDTRQDKKGTIKQTNPRQVNQA